MSKEMEKTEKLNVQLKGESADKFKRIKAYLGLEQDTEVIRALITWYYNTHADELTGPPKTFWHINLNNNGVMVWDPALRLAVQLRFTPKGIICEQDGGDECKHVEFAISKSDVQQIIRQRRREGWELPSV